MDGLMEQVRVYGIQPVPQAERRLGFLDTFVLWWDLGVSFLVMVVGMFLVPGLSLGQALLAIVVGAILGNFLLGLVGTIGSDTGVPTMVLLRPVLGRRGSIAPSVLNVLQLLGWAIFEVIVMAQAAALLSDRLFGVKGYLGWVVFFTLLGTVMAIGGPIVVVKQWMERFAVWVVLITIAWVTVAVLTSYDVRAWLARPGTGYLRSRPVRERLGIFRYMQAGRSTLVENFHWSRLLNFHCQCPSWPGLLFSSPGLDVAYER